jgi:hypothetical protein
MRDNLRLYHTILPYLVKCLPEERITRVRNLALFMTGLVLSMSVHLSQIVKKLPPAAQQRSLVNRLRRFVDNPRVDVRACYEPVVVQLLAAFENAPLRLIVDCSKLGFDYRMLTVAIAYRKRALPLAWSIHRGRKGHIQAQEQIALLRYVHSLLRTRRRAPVWVLGDSGFQSVRFLRWLRQRGWQFVVRVTGQVCVSTAGQPWRRLADLDLKPGETRVLGWVRLTQQHNYGWLYLVAHWAHGHDEPWYLVTTQPNPRQALRYYAVRMWTEEMYGDMKGHGFDLEATHLRDTARLSRLLLAVCWVYVWFLTLGSWVVKNGLRARLDVKSRRDKSYFRLGWDWIDDCLRLGNPFRLWFVPY